MTNIQDLHIEEEIIPLFDFTSNFFSGQVLRALITQPLEKQSEILSRQKILQGFISNHKVWQEYSFLQFNVSEIHSFFETFAAGNFSGSSLRSKLIFSEKERHQKRGKLILLILLLNKIHRLYMSRMDTKLFPTEYATELGLMNNFLNDFNLEHYEAVYRKKNTINIKHIVELTGIMTEKVTNGEAAAFWQRWFLFEAHLSISKGIVAHGFTFPSFEDSSFSISDFYHPLLKNPVKNNIDANRNVILLTGPNMSGKSTLLKSISLCVYLAHTGLAIPASKATIPFFNTISVAINLTDSIVSGYSHFMSEIISLKNVLTEALKGSKCFAVFDELFRGTNIEDAFEISSATITGLTKFNNSFFFISTHLHQLKEIEVIKNGEAATLFIECELQENTPRFTYKLKDGWSDLKIGRILFEKEGLNDMLG